MHWYLIHTKPRQEQRALSNLQQQGYTCFLPTIRVEKLRRDRIAAELEPLFPRYLFIQLSHDQSAKSWSPIRSTLGVSRLVSFGNQPAQAQDSLIAELRRLSAAETAEIRPLFQANQRVQICDGAFSGLEGIFQIIDGEHRALVLIELMSQQTLLQTRPGALKAVK